MRSGLQTLISLLLAFVVMAGIFMATASFITANGTEVKECVSEILDA